MGDLTQFGNLGSTGPLPEKQGFKPLPEGDYIVIVEDRRIKQGTESGNSDLSRTLQVAPGQEGAGRQIWDMLMLPITGEPMENRDAKVQRINQLCACCGIEGLTDSAQFLGKRYKVRLKMDKQDATKNAIAWRNPAGDVPAADAPVSRPAVKVAPKPAVAGDDEELPF